MHGLHHKFHLPLMFQTHFLAVICMFVLKFCVKPAFLIRPSIITKYPHKSAGFC